MEYNLIMGILLVSIISLVQPEDATSYYGLDMNWAMFSRDWEYAYETSRHGLRTAQGSHDLARWYQIYQGKTEISLTRWLSLRYRLYVLNDFETRIHEHRFEPNFRVAPEFYLHLVVVPNYLKNTDEFGLGMTWRRGNKHWLAIYGIVQNLEHNLSIYYVRPGPERAPYRQVPFKFELDARGELDWVRLRLHTELGTRASQYLDWPDSTWEVWEEERDSSSAWGRLEARPIKNLWLGARGSVNMERAQTWWPGQEITTADTLRDFWVKPYISYSPTDRVEFLGEYQLWNTYRDTDSLQYKRTYRVFTASAVWHPHPVFWLHAGYQRSVRHRYHNDSLLAEPWSSIHSGAHPQSRLMINVEFRFSSGFMLIIKEGLEMDYFPQDLFRSPHNHTYVQVYIPLNAVFDPEKTNDS